MGSYFWREGTKVLKGVAQWFFDLLVGTVTPIMDVIESALAAVIPPGAALDPAPLLPYVAAVNAWVPIDLAVLLFLAWLALEMSLMSVRWILKLLPGFG